MPSKSEHAALANAGFSARIRTKPFHCLRYTLLFSQQHTTMTTPATLVRIETRDLRQATPGRPSRPIHGDTTYLTLESFSAQHGQLSSGVWEATAGAFRSHCAGYVEFCHIVEGSCRVVDPDGTRHSFAAGDSFVLPEGFAGHWEVDERVKKVFFIARTTA